MSTQLLSKFTPEIVRGAKSLGVSMHEQSTVLRPDQAEKIQAQTGRTLSELALLGIAAGASPEKQRANSKLLRDTLELMSVFDQGQTSSPTARKTRLKAKT